MAAFIDRLLEAIDLKGSCTLVGLDPRLELLPEEVLTPTRGGVRAGLSGAAAAVEAFGGEVIDIVAPYVPAVKLQIAFYEQFGWHGLRAYRRLVEHAHRQGLLVIGDVKRGDVASTAAAYADGHLGRTEVAGRRLKVFDVDAVTLNPYLGSDGIEPFLDVAREFGKGLFVLVRTSNPSAGELQHLVADGRPVYLHVADLVRTWGAGLMGEEGYSSVGAVVGATSGAALAEARRALPRAIFLVPGYGAQGATAADLAAAFNPDGRGAVVNSSRGIIFAWTREPYRAQFGPGRWREAIEAAVRAMRADLAAALEAPGA